MSKKNWIAALMFSLPWTVIMLLINVTIKGDELTLSMFTFTLLGGIVAGLLFAWSMQFMGKYLYKKITVETAAHEKIIKEGGASHLRGMERVGGKLVLTDQRLIFKSHKVNIQNHQYAFDLAQLEQLYATKTFRFLKNGLLLELINQDSHRFMVDEPADWIEKISGQQQLSY